LLTDE